MPLSALLILNFQYLYRVKQLPPAFMNELERLFQQITGRKPTEFLELTPTGSNRHYYRLVNDRISLIGVIGTSPEENKAYITLARHFYELKLPVPQLLAVSPDGMTYLQEDMGDTLLFDYISQGRENGTFSDSEKQMLHETIKMLPRFQVNGAKELDFSVCYPQPEFNERSVFWDLNYFKYYFLKPSGTEFQENRLEDDFVRFSEVLLQSPTNTFMYRDFQSRNVMIKNEMPYFIDFQGGRKGPVHYDIASFLWQAKAQYPTELKEELLQTYIQALRELMPVDEKRFREQLNHFVLFRTLQVLGAYGFRGYFEQKPHFLQSIPYALSNLKAILSEQTNPQYPYLIEILNTMTDNMEGEEKESSQKSLTVKVYSFSYRKGIPADTSGNGGGFVFDCRAIHNPGKYEQYKSLTGLDAPVIEFLEKDGEILTFLDRAYELAGASVARYVERGFDSLMVCFGCTGGQHRSVYSAQKMAEHIHKKYGVKVELCHREQNINEVFEIKKK